MSSNERVLVLSQGAERIAVFGGVYSNHLALEAAIEDARRRGAEALFCLGDLGAFGPNPDKCFPLLVEEGVITMQGNYDDSIARGLADCQCGYTDPRDNYFAKLSYDYTFAKTGPAFREWLGKLPQQIRLQLGKYRVLMSHGSPRKINEFLWESTTPTHFLEELARDYEADVLLCTHTGIKWYRELSHDRHFVNVGVLGRPENDGRARVWYTLLTVRPSGGVYPECNRRAQDRSRLEVEFVPLEYNYRSLAAEMRAERLPQEFIETILTGWWTTCLEVLPAKERRRGRF